VQAELGWIRLFNKTFKQLIDEKSTFTFADAMALVGADEAVTA